MQISDEIKSYMESVPFGMLAVKLDLGAGLESVILVKSTRDLLSSLREKKAAVNIGWVVNPTEAGPVACMCLTSTGDGIGELVGELYFDVLIDEELEMIETIGTQERLMAALFDEEMDLVWATEIKWGDLAQLYAEQAGDRARELGENATREGVHADFKKASELFRDEVPLKR
jgi:hypothetical protein